MTLKTDLIKEISSEKMVHFGRFPFEADGTVKPIEWRVLNHDPVKVLLISEYGIDARPYHDEYKESGWNSYTLRKWLNGEFLETSFDDEERALVLTRHNENNVGSATDDKAFLLSVDEVQRYFKENSDRQCRPSPYALKQGAFESGGYGWWWLRPISSNSLWCADGVCSSGCIDDDYFADADVNDILVRPALLLSLEC